MKVYDLIQGSPEWLAHRASRRNASDAAAMLGCSPYMTRSELQHAMHTGMRPEPKPDQQRRFDKGHAIEAVKRPPAEIIIGEDLYPVSGSEVVDGIELSASFDGLTMLEDTNWECKSLNEDLRAALPNPGPDGNDAANLPKFYRVQMQQQCMVSGCARVLFTASDGEQDDRHCWFYPDADLAREILAGWRQFDADLAAYVPAEVVVPAVAAPVESLPAVSVQMNGSLSVVSNLDVFGAKLREFIAKVPAKPSTEQEFVDCDAAVKALKRAEEALDGAEANALGQVQSVEQITRTIADLRTVARTARLATEKLVTARKQQIRTEEVQRGKDALAAFVVDLNLKLGHPLMPTIAADFGAAISGKKTLDSVRNAIDTELARAKIAANEVFATITANQRTLRELASEHRFLFADTAQIVLKAPDDCRALVALRIADHRDAEERKEAATRERIRQEEQAKAEKAAREKLEAEQRQAATPAPTAAPIAAPAVSSPAANVVPLGTRAPAAPVTPPSLKLGEINERIAPLSMTAEGLRTLGFEPAGRKQSAVLYHEADLVPIVRAAIAHLGNVADQRQAA
jgi:predicted phage-related endonuclease